MQVSISGAAVGGGATVHISADRSNPLMLLKGERGRFKRCLVLCNYLKAANFLPQIFLQSFYFVVVKNLLESLWVKFTAPLRPKKYSVLYVTEDKFSFSKLFTLW